MKLIFELPCEKKLSEADSVLCASDACLNWKLAFLRIIREMEKGGKAQFLIATHSPILLAYPDAVIYSFDGANVERICYEDTEHYQLTKAFLTDRERFFEQLFDD